MSYAIGIDLGTTHSLLAVKGLNEIRARIVPIEGSNLMPSAVRISGDRTFVGYSALVGLSGDFGDDSVITSVKRLMGRDVEKTQLMTPQGRKSAVEISSLILKALSEKSGIEVERAVITVPAYFDDAQRQQTRDAARLAGIEVLRLINEPTAAALAYGLDKLSDGIFLVFDLGGGTFDVSVLELSEGSFEVLSTHGDTNLGGDDFDILIAREIAGHLKVRIEDLSSKIYQRLLIHSRSIKEKLTDSEFVDHELSDLFGRGRFTMSRSRLDELSGDLKARIRLSLKSALRDAKLSADDLEQIVLVGGSSRMPLIRRMLREFFPRKTLLSSLNPDEVVAIGAAHQASMLLNPEQQNWILLDVNPLSLGLETMGGLVEKIIFRNSKLPVSVTQDFTTSKDGQTALALHIVQGERELVDECRSLARFELQGIPPMPAGMAKIEVKFEVDVDGLLKVTARERTTNVQSSLQIKSSYGLSEEKIAQILQDSINHSEEDKLKILILQKKISADALIDTLDAALREDSKLLTPDELGKLENGLSRLKDIVNQVEFNREYLKLISGHVHSLGHDANDFAQRRMNLAISSALRGKNIDDL